MSRIVWRMPRPSAYFSAIFQRDSLGRTSWTLEPDTDRRILDWVFEDGLENYVQVGLVDILGPQDTRSYWDQEQINRTPESEFWLTVYERSNGEGGAKKLIAR